MIYQSCGEDSTDTLWINVVYLSHTLEFEQN